VLIQISVLPGFQSVEKIMSKKLERLPSWQRQLDEQIGAGLWSRPGLFGLLDHPERANRLGELLSGRDRERALADLDLFLAGRLVPRPESAPITAVESTPPALAAEPPCLIEVSTGNLVEALLRAGVHKYAQRPGGRRRGMDEKIYGDLWPTTVTYPAEGYAWRYPHILLIDQTLKPDKLQACCANTDFPVNPAACRVLPGVSEHLLGPDGQPLKRAVIFWGYEQNLDRKVKDCRLEASATHIPMIHWHGLWIIIQYAGGILCHHTIDLPGSSFGDPGAPCVGRRDNARPNFSAGFVDGQDPYYGSGFRGSELVPVL